MSLSCGRCNTPILIHLGQDDRQADDSLIATADRYRCPYCGTAGTYYVDTDGAVVLTDCLCKPG